MKYLKSRKAGFNLISLIGILILSSFYSCKEKGIILVENGKTDYEIVTTENPDNKVILSAKELQNYLKKISKVEIPVVGEKNQNKNRKKIFLKILDIDKNTVSIKSEGSDLTIGGGSADAVKNAVYVFLEEYLNCDWYAPNAEKIPELNSVLLKTPINYTYTPEIITRTVHSRLFYNDPVFAGKLRVTTESFPYYVPIARVHTFRRFIPEEKFYKKHPEYFALRNGKRIPTQLCLTSEKVLEIVKDSVASLFKRYLNASVISVSQNDNTQYCTCDKCSKIDKEEESPAGTMIQFVNKVAADFPDKTISTLAYQYTRKPCKTKPADNVLITLCSIECDRSAPITEKCTPFADDLRGWNQLTNHIRIWDYTTQFTNFLAPFPNIETLQPNIQFFRDNHAKWIFEQHSSNPSELFELRSYLTAKLLWNPDKDFNEIITDFTNGYYEEAGVYIKKYIDLIHQKIKEDPDFFLFLYGDPSQAFDSYLNPELLKEYDGFFDEAEKAVAQKSVILRRVKEARLGVDYAILEACRKNLSKEFSLTILDKNSKKKVNPYVKNKLEQFIETCKNAEITMMNEMRFTVEDYASSYQKALEVATQPNKALGKKVTLLTKPKKYANEDPQVLTDGALGGNGFYANWLGFEGNDLEAVIDLGETQSVSSISIAFLQVTNHVVFFPLEVTYSYSNDNKNFRKLGIIKNEHPLIKKSKVNDIQYFNLKFSPLKARYIKVKAKSMKTPPYWHHATGQPSWIFADEVLVD
jgi:hypothetical protein